MMPDLNNTNAQMGFGYGPQAYINGPENFVYIEDPLTELSQSSGAIIRQQPELLEMLTGFKTRNRYHVFLQTPMGLKYAFKCNERSGICTRCCYAPEQRPLELIIRHIISFDQLDNNLAKVFIRAYKPFTMRCCCCCMPFMDVVFADNNQYLGRLTEPFACCNDDIDIYDSSENLRYEIVGDCCQFGLCCGKSVEKLSSINFDIRQNGSLVGSIRKLSASFGEFFSSANSYQIIFPPRATPEEKLIIIIAGLMIDYQFFERDDRFFHHTNFAFSIQY